MGGRRYKVPPTAVELPLGRGFLTGQIKKFDDLAADDYRRHSPRFQGDNFAQNLTLLQEVEALAAEKNATPGQIALAWVMAQGDDIVPIPGTKRRRYLEENAKAEALVLTVGDLRRLAAAFPKGVAAGERYIAASMKAIDS